jgi:dephospho-CoA kinase
LALEREAHAHPGQLVVHVVPLLFETNYGDLVDKTILVTAPDAVRIARIAARDRLDEERVRARMAAQISPERGRHRADYVIENAGDLATLSARTGEVYARLTSQAPRS